jgi:hypothetical protein
MLLLVLLEGAYVVTFMPTNKTNFKPPPPPLFLFLALFKFFFFFLRAKMRPPMAKGLEVIK